MSLAMLLVKLLPSIRAFSANKRMAWWLSVNSLPAMTALSAKILKPVFVASQPAPESLELFIWKVAPLSMVMLYG